MDETNFLQNQLHLKDLIILDLEQQNEELVQQIHNKDINDAMSNFFSGL